MVSETQYSCANLPLSDLDSQHSTAYIHIHHPHTSFREKKKRLIKLIFPAYTNTHAHIKSSPTTRVEGYQTRPKQPSPHLKHTNSVTQKKQKQKQKQMPLIPNTRTKKAQQSKAGLCKLTLPLPSHRPYPIFVTTLPHKTPSSYRTIPPPLDGVHITLSPARNRAHIAHPILISLITVFLARIRSLPTIIPGRDARKEPVKKHQP
jgi:hypothetical protein